MKDGLKIKAKDDGNHFTITTKDTPEEIYADFMLEDAVQGWVNLYGEKYGVTAKEFTIVLPWAEQTETQQDNALADRSD